MSAPGVQTVTPTEALRVHEERLADHERRIVDVERITKVSPNVGLVVGSLVVAAWALIAIGVLGLAIRVVRFAWSGT